MICFVDADGIINPIALNDVLERFHSDKRMWAISCPYTPSNMDSFWAKMQDIEYTMLKFVQWCYNVTSALAARWGCLVVRKQAFNEVGMFSLHAITEDMDLALKMNKYHRHVQQSPCEIKSEVPYTFQMWLKQKIRRCSGGTQAFLSYVSVWIRNPLHMIFTLLLFSVSIFWTIALFTRLIFFGEIIDIFISLLDILTLKHGWNFIMALYGNQIITNSIQASAFTLLSLPYILFAIKSKDQRWKVLLLFPYTLFYMSLYGIIWLYSTWLGIYKFATLKKWVRSW
jgi:GT2 family glycosyltransferase